MYVVPLIAFSYVTEVNYRSIKFVYYKKSFLQKHETTNGQEMASLCKHILHFPSCGTLSDLVPDMKNDIMCHGTQFFMITVV